jgi:hypothetical protein
MKMVCPISICRYGAHWLIDVGHIGFHAVDAFKLGGNGDAFLFFQLPP